MELMDAMEVEAMLGSTRIGRLCMADAQGHRPGHGRSTPLEALALRKIIVSQLSGRRKERTVAATL